MSQQTAAAGEERLEFSNGVYRTPQTKVSWLSRTFPTWSFYRQFFWNVYRSSVKSRRGTYDDEEWIRTSCEVVRSLESVGVDCEFAGEQHVRQLDAPCVFVANHMSMCETVVLPSIIRPHRPVTFVVKQSLLEYPVFRHILRTRNPIAVTRDNPREDFKVMMQEGVKRLEDGMSVVVFPQTTRSTTFDAAQFNSIGVKLAARAGVSVVPTALKTDAWANGKWIKDLGPIDPNKKIYITFGEPMTVDGRGGEQQAETIDYISSQLSRWSQQDAPDSSTDAPR